MASKGKTEGKVPTLKGQEAEDKILEYLTRMNRPFGAVDVAANLKGAIPKATVQKLLVSLAEKGGLVQKLYGKTTFFVVNQANLEIVPAERLASLDAECISVQEINKDLNIEVKSLVAELSKIKSAPTNDELNTQISALEGELAQVQSSLEPLRSGSKPISAEDLQKLQADWEKWKAEWFRRRKIFQNLWHLAIDALPPQDAQALEEDLGVERDSVEHQNLEKGPLCSANTLKRKRCN
ncbi:TBPIP-domain-containing protein [Coprinopsis marcescibilis]|uniref:TBPIP-domain-containing protein n=1 Tax=Coprinopsis marcescibilis TaxID=230819 RepID=A0A5C3KTE2_COPMA|nr:TBPIP-domain-containing protein [Coprinopsis marcescibilis]